MLNYFNVYKAKIGKNSRCGSRTRPLENSLSSTLLSLFLNYSIQIFGSTFFSFYLLANLLHPSIQQNRPLNSQNAADSLQKYNLKKTAVQKALDALADSGQISFKEYGKQKIYIARQDQFDIPNSVELDQMKEENAKLEESLKEQRSRINEIEGEIKALQSNLTLEQIRAKEAQLSADIKEMEDKLNKLRGGVELVNPEERKAVEQIYLESIGQWRRRKRMFKDLWDAITENSPKDLKEFKEELGIEYDEDVGVSLQSYCNLMQHGKKRTKYQ